MTQFHEVLFPVDIAFNSEGGPTRRTEIVTLVSGHEERNSPWAASRRGYNAGYGVKSLADIEAVIAFFEARKGRLHGFRFRDPFDHKSCPLANDPQANDQIVAIGDGAETQFQLYKTYQSGGAAAARPIRKPVAGSVLAAVGGAGAPFTLDETTGIITFDDPPAASAVITAGFLFDTPVRFDADSLRINLAAFRAGDIPSIPLIEVLV
ncbi:MAG: TIGR02217 family protein [Amphiplicatus sp.]